MGKFFFSIFLLTMMGVIDAQAADELRVHFLDVGYGAATLIQYASGEAFLIDAGSAEAGPTVVDYLRELGIETLDGLVITHPHEDHYGGVLAVMDAVEVKQLYYNGDARGFEGESAEVMMQIVAKMEPVILQRGDVFFSQADQRQIVVVHPDQVDMDRGLNDASLGLMVQHDDVVFFLASDMQPDGQGAALEAFPDLVQAEVIQFPHHGGLLSERFVETFRDRTFVLSVGENPWGKPIDDELEKVAGTLWRTDEHGAVRVVTDGMFVSILSN